MKAIEKRIAARLLSSGELSEADLEVAVKEFKGKTDFKKFLIDKQFVTPSAAARAMAEVDGFEFIVLRETLCDAGAVTKLTSEEAWTREVLPVKFDEQTLTVALSDTSKIFLLDDLKIRLGCQVKVAIAEEQDLYTAMVRHYGRSPHGSRFDQTATVSDVATGDEPTKLLNQEAKPVYRRRMEDMDTMQLVDLEKVRQETEKQERDSKEESHQAFQRKIRELKATGISPDDPPGISHAPTKLDTDKDTAIEEDTVDYRRASFGILEKAFELNAFEVELTGEVKHLKVRYKIDDEYRRGETPRGADPYKVINDICSLAGVTKDSPINPMETRSLQMDGKTVPCRLFLQHVRNGQRLVIRFPENSALLVSPIRESGLPESVANEIYEKLNSVGGGLFFITVPNTAMLERIYCSLAKELSAEQKRSFLSLETIPLRSIEGVTSVSCESREDLEKQLVGLVKMPPDIVGVPFLDSATMLKRVLETSLCGTTGIAGFTAIDQETALACFPASGIDAMNLVRGVIGNLHIEEYRQLCMSCHKPIKDKGHLPAWAKDSKDVFHEANPKGCGECRHTGFKGSVFIADYNVPDKAKADGSFQNRVSRQDIFETVCRDGRLDPMMKI